MWFAIICTFSLISNVHRSRISSTIETLDRIQYNIFALSPPIAEYANGAIDTSYDYAVPELGNVPLLNADCTNSGRALSSTGSEQDSIFSKASRNNKTEDKKVSCVSHNSSVLLFAQGWISLRQSVISTTKSGIFKETYQILMSQIISFNNFL